MTKGAKKFKLSVRVEPILKLKKEVDKTIVLAVQIAHEMFSALRKIQSGLQIDKFFVDRLFGRIFFG